MGGIMFLLILGLVYLIFASIEDLKKREVANWLSFSLIIFALGYRFFYSLFTENFNFLFQGLIGLGIFFVLANLFYYSRMFAGGDAKLMITMGVILAFSESLFINLKIFMFFLIVFLFVGGIYGVVISLFLGLRNFKIFKKEFSRRLHKNKKYIYLVMALGIVVMLIGLISNLFFVLGIIIFIFPYFYFYAKSVDEACMVKKVKSNKLTEGDWLYENIKINGKIIKAKWEGLSKKEIKLIQKQKKDVLVRYGIPFVPVFLISFVILIYLWFSGWINLFGF